MTIWNPNYPEIVDKVYTKAELGKHYGLNNLNIPVDSLPDIHECRRDYIAARLGCRDIHEATDQSATQNILCSMAKDGYDRNMCAYAANLSPTELYLFRAHTYAITGRASSHVSDGNTVFREITGPFCFNEAKYRMQDDTRKLNAAIMSVQYGRKSDFLSP